MRTREFEKLVKLLNERREQILLNIAKANEEMDSFADAEANDEADFATIATDTMIDTAITQKNVLELKEIEYALSKARSGTFGVCEMCGEVIGLDRMRVKPHARFCIVCRETYEKNTQIQRRA